MGRHSSKSKTSRKFNQKSTSSRHKKHDRLRDNQKHPPKINRHKHETNKLFQTSKPKETEKAQHKSKREQLSYSLTGSSKNDRGGKHEQHQSSGHVDHGPNNQRRGKGRGGEGEILKPRDKHKATVKQASSGSYPCRGPQLSRKKKKIHHDQDMIRTHSHYLNFRASLKSATAHLLTELPLQVDEHTQTILQQLSTIDTTIGENYNSLVTNLRATLLPNKGSLIPLASIKRFKQDCSGWENEMKKLIEEYAVEDRILAELGREVGIGDHEVSGEGGHADMDDDATLFESLQEQVKFIGKTWIAKAEKAEKEILQIETRQSMLMMQAM